MTFESRHPGPRGDTVARLEAAGVCVPGATFVATGTVLVLAAFTVLPWFRGSIFGPTGTDTTFSGVGHTLDVVKQQFADANLTRYVSFGAAGPYFSWLGWTLLLAAAAAGGLAVSRFGRRWVLRWLGAVVGVTGGALTFLAINLATVEGNAKNNANLPTYGQYFAHAGAALWSAALGFVLIAVGALMPHRD